MTTREHADGCDLSQTLESRGLENSKLGLYVHVPFCRSKCRYCDFCSHPPAAGDIDRYARALSAEIQLRRTERTVRSIYFGGGTPSFAGAALLQEILSRFCSLYRLQPDCEITVEANPCDMSAEWLAACRAMGVNRLSIGAQGMRDEDLRFLGRAHDVTEAFAAIGRARAAEFHNISIDLIVGLPGHTPAGTKAIVERAVSLFAPEHISCYQLTCAEGTPLRHAVESGEVRMPDADTEAAIFMQTHETMQALGYEGYEVSNFARSRALRSRHNSAYWTHSDYLGFGPSAHSFVSPVRSWNSPSPADYCSFLERGRLPVAGQERLTDAERASEIILLGLRTNDGFSLEELRRRCGVDLLADKRAVVESLQQSGLLAVNGDRLTPTLRGMAMADYLAVELA